MRTLSLLLLLASNPELPKALEQIRALEDEAALATLERALARPGNTPNEVGTAHLYRGLVHAIRGKESGAVAEFQQALALDPELRLPGDLSPVVIEWWKRAGGKDDAPRQEAPPPQVLIPPSAAVEAPRTHSLRYVGLGMSAGAVGALAVGLGVGMQAQGLHARAAAEEHAGPAQSLQRDAESWATAANVLFVAAGVLMAAAVVFFVLDL